MKFPTNKTTVTRILLVNLFAQSAIIATGAIVRITKSGLGCPTWPQCVGDSIVPLANQTESFHKFIEFGNRLLTFVLVIAAALLVLTIWRNPALKSLRGLSLAPIVGTLIQAILGGVTVLTGLHPLTVSAHFLTSIVLVALSHTLLRRYMSLGAQKRQKRSANVLVLSSFVTVVLGTLVTGSGPHSGDKEVSSRYEFDLSTIANIHAKSVWIYFVILVVLAYKQYRNANHEIRRSFAVVALVVISQGLLGYYQFFQGVPETLVFAHIIGSILFWVSNLRLRYDLMQN
jgi:cytochrome c oxidase assembly protein subunit 15